MLLGGDRPGGALRSPTCPPSPAAEPALHHSPTQGRFTRPSALGSPCELWTSMALQVHTWSLFHRLLLSHCCVVHTSRPLWPLWAEGQWSVRPAWPDSGQAGGLAAGQEVMSPGQVAGPQREGEEERDPSVQGEGFQSSVPRWR